MNPAASQPSQPAGPTTEGEVIQNSVDSAKGWLDGTAAGTITNATNVVNGVIDTAEKAGVGAVKTTFIGSANFGDSFVTSLSGGVEQFVAGTLNVIETKVDKAVDKYVAEAVQKLKSIPVIGGLVGDLAETAASTVENYVHQGLAAAGKFAENELHGLLSSGDKKVTVTLTDIANRIEKPLENSILSSLEPLRQEADGAIKGAATDVQNYGDNAFQLLGTGATNVLGGLAK
jgi:hypothetical protein